MNQRILNTAIKQFLYYKELGEKTIGQLSEDQLFVEINKDVNSISIIVQHLSGNMLSRFSDFLNSDGEKPWRNRDEEFESREHSKTDLLEIWNNGWNCLLNTLNNLKEDDLKKDVFIRNEGHTVQEAITRQLCHYSYHIGQIVFIGKIILGDKWHSLSIPKGGSQSFNEDKFSKEKGTRHFTSDDGPKS